MKACKKITAVALVVSVLLALCACGKGNTAEAQKPETGTVTQLVEPREESSPAEETAEIPETEAVEAGFSPVTLYDGDYCTIVQTSEPYVHNYILRVDMAIVNKSDSTLTYDIGQQLYINDVRRIEPVYIIGDGMTDPGETEMFSVDMHVTEEADVKIDCSISVVYDNGLNGVYAQHVEAVNDMFNFHTPAVPVSDRYVLTGDEMAVIDNGDFKIVAMNYDTGRDSYSYWMKLYLENDTDEDMTFYFIDGVMLSSDIQEEEYEIIYKSGAAIGEPQDSFAIEPGMGCYLTASFKKDLLNGYAVDINEVVTINFPVRVDNIWDDDIFDSEPSYDAVEGETYVLTFTRDQLVN